MKALFLRKYDFGESEEFIVASEDPIKLEKYYFTKCVDYPLIEESSYGLYYNNDKAHYIIKDIEFLC